MIHLQFAASRMSSMMSPARMCCFGAETENVNRARSEEKLQPKEIPDESRQKAISGLLARANQMLEKDERETYLTKADRQNLQTMVDSLRLFSFNGQKKNMEHAAKSLKAFAIRFNPDNKPVKISALPESIRKPVLETIRQRERENNPARIVKSYTYETASEVIRFHVIFEGNDVFPYKGETMLKANS